MSISILFIRDVEDSLRRAGCLNDYLSDMVYHGLVELLGESVKTSSINYPMFKCFQNQIDQKLLWGKGFTTSWLFDHYPMIESDIEEKIANRFYDLIIYGNIHISDRHYHLVNRFYDPHKVIMLDGIDQDVIHSTSLRHPYFKRELNRETFNVHPISFSIPECKLFKQNVSNKERFFATNFPSNKHTYVFSKEEDYFNDYRESYFAFTMKKHGWDCLRHYEILANRCVPLFFDISMCPRLTMTNFPKDLMLQAIDLFKHFNVGKYLSFEAECFNYTCEKLTTKKLAEYVLNRI